jgi:hypothetical protein
MNRDILDIGRVVALIGVIPMIIVALLVATSVPSDSSEILRQMLAVSAAPAIFILCVLFPAILRISSSWGKSRSRNTIKGLLIVLAGIAVFLLAPYSTLYTDLNNLINQAGAAIAIVGGLLIIIGAWLKS